MKDDVLKQWKETSSELIQLLRSVNQEQFNKTPFQGSWSAGQLGEHILKSYGAIEVLNGNTEKVDRPADEKVAGVKSLFLDFSIKMKSPEEILPSENPLNKESIINGLQEKIEAFNLVVENKDLTETCTDYAIPEYGPFTRLEWINFNIVHTQRHIHQLKRIISYL